MKRWAYVQAYEEAAGLAFRHTIVFALDLDGAYEEGHRWSDVRPIKGLLNDYVFPIDGESIPARMIPFGGRVK